MLTVADGLALDVVERHVVRKIGDSAENANHQHSRDDQSDRA